MADEKFLTLAEINRRAREKPILVGGGAVEFYTFGHFVTGDLDLCAQAAQIAPVLEEMGFKKDCMYFIRGKQFIHVPGPGFKGRYDDIKLAKGGPTIRVISLEDLIIDRLNSCKWWKYRPDCEQAGYLLNTYRGRLDLQYLRERAVQEDVLDMLEKSAGRIPASRAASPKIKAKRKK
jgi:hypothetical protein